MMLQAEALSPKANSSNTGLVVGMSLKLNVIRNPFFFVNNLFILTLWDQLINVL